MLKDVFQTLTCLLVLFVFGCDGEMVDIGDILKTSAVETEVDRNAIQFLHGDDIPSGVTFSGYVDIQDKYIYQDLRSILCWRGFKPRQRRAGRRYSSANCVSPIDMVLLFCQTHFYTDTEEAPKQKHLAIEGEARYL